METFSKTTTTNSIPYFAQNTKVDYPSPEKWCYFYPLGDSKVLQLGLFADTTTSSRECNNQKQAMQMTNFT